MPALSAGSAGKIYLYGERHGDEEILKMELAIWAEHYNKHSHRHLFLELPFYTVEFLNMWMKADGDEILDQVYDEWEGTANHKPLVKKFYKVIKTRFPETIFHGTDVGHQYKTTGKRYLEYLVEQNQQNSEKYANAQAIIEQGKHYYAKKDKVYRENMMVVNFVRAFNSLKDENIMGIYGSAHTGIDAMYPNNSVPSMANQLHKIYGDQLKSKNLTGRAQKTVEPQPDKVLIKGVEYEAMYYGKQDLKGFKDFDYRAFWRLEGAYPKFRDASKTGDKLPYGNYPMKVETGQVFVIDYKKMDGTLIRKYYRSDGNSWKNRPTTEEFRLE